MQRQGCHRPTSNACYSPLRCKDWLLRVSCCVDGILHSKSTSFGFQQAILLPLDPRPLPSAGTRMSTPECEACTVCASGYGRGAANECHRCTTGFRAVMYFLFTMVAVCALVMLALLVVYLVRKARVAIGVLAANISEDSRDPRVTVAVVHFHEQPFHFLRA